MSSSNPRFPIRLMDTFRSVFYTPIYVSVAGGFLEREGLDVSFSTCPARFPHPLSALHHGAADIVQSGIMRCIIASDWGAETVPAHFAKINDRDGFFLLGRQPQEQFRWDSLPGTSLIPVGFSPMPWASLQYALRNNGVDPASLELVHGLPLEQAVAAFRAGRGDFIHLPEPAAEELIAEGSGHLAVALGPVNGPIAYSSFACTRQFMEANPEVVQRFVAGFARALQCLHASDAATVAEMVSPFFSDLPAGLIGRAVGRYKAQDTWPGSPVLAEEEYSGLQEILVSAGLVKERQPYDKVVRPEFAQAATG